MSFLRIALLIVAALGLTACGGAGPQTMAIMNAPGAQKLDRTAGDEPFILVDVGMNFAQRLSKVGTEPDWRMPQGGPSSFVIGVSDVLDISIVSSNDTGYIDFNQAALAPISTTPLPQQVVAEDGTVAVPLLGRVRASGQTIQALESLLTRRLSEVLVSPTAIVQMVERQSATVSVVGEGVGNPGTYPINLSDRRLLDIVGRAGGPVGEAKDIIVSLVRGGVTYQAVLFDVYGNKALNVYVHAGDLISLEPRSTRIQVVGATGSNTLVEIQEVDVSLMDALGEGGGLESPRADLKGVFVFREAAPEQMRALGADLSDFAGQETIPVVYRFDMTQPSALFTAKAFRMMDDDILYVADSTNAKLSNIFGATGFFAPDPSAYVQDATLGN